MLDSKGEIKIHNVLTAANLSFREEYEFPDLKGHMNVPLRFDFCVFKDNGDVWFLIEFNGEQHYHPVARFGGQKTFNRQRENDIKKRRYCLEHDLKLITIPYYEEDKISFNYIMQAAGYYQEVGFGYCKE